MEKPTHVVHIVDEHLHPQDKEFIFALSHHIRKQYLMVSLICVKDSEKAMPPVLNDDFESYLTVEKKGSAVKFIRDLADVMRSSNSSVVHVHSPHILFPAAIAAKLSGKKAIVTFYEAYEKKAPPFTWGMYQRVICTGENIKRALIKNNKLKEDQCSLIYCGVDTLLMEDSQNDISRSEIRQSLGLREDQFIVGNIDPLQKDSDHRTLLKAFQKLVKKEFNGVLLIVGDGPLKEELQKVIAGGGMTDKVKIVEPQGNIHEIVQIMDCFVSTTYREITPNEVLKVMALGKPVIITKVGNHHEIVLDKLTGIVVPCGYPERLETAIMRLFINRNVAVEMGEAGRVRFNENYHIEPVTKSYLSIYKQG